MVDYTPSAPASNHPVPSYVATLFRSSLAAGAGYLVGQGTLTADQSEQLVGAGMMALPVLWGLLRAHLDAKKLNAAIAAPAGQAR